MRLKFFLIILILIFSCNFVYAGLYDNLVDYWSFDINADDDLGSNDGTVTNALHSDTLGKRGGYYNFNGVNAKICFPNSASYNFSRTDNFTVSLWLNSSTNGQGTAIFGKQENGAPNEGWNIIHQTGKVFGYLNDVNGNTITKDITETKITKGTWQHLVMRYNGTSTEAGLGMYLNGTYTEDAQTADTMNGVSWNDAKLCIAIRDDVGFGFWKGDVDEIGIWNRILTNDEINLLETYFYSSYSIILNSPSNTTINNTNSYNFIFTPNDFITPITNCSIYLNGTLNFTNTTVITEGVINTIPATLSEGTYLWSVGCDNGSNTFFSNFNFSLTIDSINPTAIANFTNGTFLRLNNNFTMHFDLSDNNLLWGYNLTINGILVNHTANIASATYSFNYTNTSWALGQNNISLWVADAHTDQNIEDKVLSKIGNLLKVDNTMLESLTEVDKITYFKTKDRYNFCFHYKNYQTILDFKMQNNCYYQKTSSYKGHFVCPDDLQWWDFENKDGIEISIDSNTNVVTTITKIPRKDFCFNSVGSLNTITYNYTLWGFNATTYNINPILESTLTTFTLRIDSPNTSYSSATTFYYNNIYYTTTETEGIDHKNYSKTLILQSVTSDTNVLWFFNFTVNGTHYNTTQTNQTIYNVNITNCSVYTMQAINFSFYNTTTGIDTKSEATMKSYVSTSYGNFNLTWSNHTNVGICILPNITSISADLQLQYTVVGCLKRNYYLSTTLDNTTDNIYLYCDSATSQVTFTVYDQYKNVLPNVLIYIQKYDVGTATATTVEIIKTDSNGQAVGNIIKNTQLYKFILVYEGSIVLETSETYILLDSYSFTLPGSNVYFDEYDHIFGDTNCNLVYNNASTSYSYTFLDTSLNVTKGCLEIYLVSNTGQTLVNSSCVNGSSGGVTLTIPPPLGSNTYEGSGVVYIGIDKFVCSNPVSATFDYGFKDYGTESLFLSFLLLVFLITVGLWNPAVAVSLMIGGIFVLNILGWFHMSKVWLIGFVIMGGIVIYKMRQS